MGGKNFLLRKIDEAYHKGLLEGFDAGLDTGIQFNNDIYQMLLNDPEVMSKDVFGAKRLVKLHKAAEEATIAYSPALRASDPESDVWRSRRDKRLKKALGEHFQSFEECYPHLTECEYGGKKK